jgi:hypothetical protein
MQSKNLPAAFALYILFGYYLLPLNIVRQGIALSLNLLSLAFLGRRTRWFVVLNVIAATMHYTAAIAAVIEFVARKWKPTVKLMLWLLAVAVVAVVLTQLPVTEHVAGIIRPRYGAYLAEARSTFGSLGLGTVLVLVFRLATLGYSWILPRVPAHDRDRVYFAIGVVFVIIGAVVTPAERLEYYFSVVAVLFLPEQIALLKRPLVHFVVTAAAAVIYFQAFLLAFGGLLPYRAQIVGQGKQWREELTVEMSGPSQTLVVGKQAQEPV